MKLSGMAMMGGLLAASAGPALATTITLPPDPGANYNQYIYSFAQGSTTSDVINAGPYTKPINSPTISNSSGASAINTGDITSTPSISLTASASSNGEEGLAKGDMELTYYGIVLSPSGNTVTVGAEAFGNVAYTPFSDSLGGPISESSALVRVSFGYSGLTNYSTSSASSPLDISTTFKVPTDNWFEVDIYAQVNVMTDGFGAVGSASAYVDPYFYIPTTDPGASQYSIEIDDKIGNSLSSGVPEPSTWAMMLLGFAGATFVGYRRGAKPAAAAA